MRASEIANKIWNCTHVMRDDDADYMSYIDQILLNLPKNNQ